MAVDGTVIHRTSSNFLGLFYAGFFKFAERIKISDIAR